MISHKERPAPEMRPYFVGNTNENPGTQMNTRYPTPAEFDNTSKRRFRTNFTEGQSLVLEEAFQESHYPDQNAKRAMSILLDIPEDRITVWFQNRRAKWRRKEVRDRERKTTDNGLSSKLSPVVVSKPSFPQPLLEPYPQTPNIPSSFQSPTSSHMHLTYAQFDNDFPRHFQY